LCPGNTYATCGDAAGEVEIAVAVSINNLAASVAVIRDGRQPIVREPQRGRR
jgi:hypothetical protein